MNGNFNVSKTPYATSQETTIEKPGRFVYLDHLKIFLTLLVLAFHAAITYGGEGSWFFEEEGASFVTSAFFTALTSLCQAFFMGLFFFIAGFFTLPSIQKKGPGRFLRARFLRLGIPLIVFFFLLSPLSEYPRYYLEQPAPLTFIPFIINSYRHFSSLGTGPLWFVQSLLVFSILTVVLYSISPFSTDWKNKSTVTSTYRIIPAPGFFLLLAAGVLLGLITFAVRLKFPINAAVSNLQFGTFPQYIAFFIFGIFINRRGIIDRLIDSSNKLWRYVSLLCIVFQPVVLIAGGALEGDISVFLGGSNWQALAYALWEQIAGIAFSLTLLRIFKRRFNSSTRFSELLSANAYTVYVVHAPVLVWLAYLALRITWPPALKFLLLFSIGAGVCLLLGQLLLRKIPIVKRLLY
ncbi:MAG: acyltransferase family protein [Spirochaetaceae bacterium]|nr:MAG: acyltransferase family protein [Spirochaetaceae bacterium]